MATHKENSDITRKAIIDGFWTLYKEMPVERITVSMVVELAHVHRSTFYRYFQDVYSFLEMIEEHLITKYTSELKNVLNKNNNISIMEFNSQVIQLWEINAEEIYYLVGNGKSGYCKRAFQEAMLPMFLQFTHLQGEFVNKDYYTNLLTSMLLTNFNFWYEHQDVYSIDEINQLALPILVSVIKNMKEDIQTASSQIIPQ